jgi:heptosyltransferase-2
VDEKSYQLLEGNEYIDRILIFNLPSSLQLKSEIFDTVINFEKSPGICALADSIKAWRRFGFRFDEYKGEAGAYDGTEQIYSLCKVKDFKRKNRMYWQEALLTMVGGDWNNQEYILGYKPKSNIVFDVGFNWKVGNKWPNKAWPKNNWLGLGKKINEKTGFSVSWQEGLENLLDYMEWIHSVKLLVTCDSLGLHLALALKKEVIVLFGPTNSYETYLYGRGKVLYPDSNYDCIPCVKPECDKETVCMEYISVEKVYERVKGIIK